MNFDIGYGEESFQVYVQPDVSHFYNDDSDDDDRTLKEPDHNGLAAKFVNMSPYKLKVYWDPGNGGPGAIISTVRPFEAIGTASFPGHVFYFTPENDSKTILHRIYVQPPQNVYYYDPFDVPNDPISTLRNLEVLSFEEYEMYERQKRTKLFNEVYTKYTGRNYLSLFPRRRPIHKMWRADFFGQQHWVTTKETHFKELPPKESLHKIYTRGRKRVLEDDQPRLLHEYRTDDTYLNMTLTVMSCAPRVFEIKNFLSDVEVDHILQLSTGMDLRKSSTSGGNFDDMDEDNNNEKDEEDDEESIRTTRTSYNTWVYREETPIVDAIYRRAADLTQIDEALLRHRDVDEYPNLGSSINIAEALQLVHYDPGQEYTAHHDFGYSEMDNPYQPARFLTLLLYLNEGMTGGETEFPRWVNGETSSGLNVIPEKGKAVLFYSQLPDGNMDDLSHHAALPVKVGEKWLMNLWVWDPIYEL